jgi:hypothetical protein
LFARKSEIEAAYGAPLSWERLDSKRACRVKHVLGEESFLAPESEWPRIQERMVSAMIRFESALRPALDAWGG